MLNRIHIQCNTVTVFPNSNFGFVMHFMSIAYLGVSMYLKNMVCFLMQISFETVFSYMYMLLFDYIYILTITLASFTIIDL